MEGQCPPLNELLSLPAEELGQGVSKHGNYVVKRRQLTQQVYRNIFEREKAAWEKAYSIPELVPILPPFCYISHTDTEGFIVQRYIPVFSLRDILNEADTTQLQPATTNEFVQKLERLFSILWNSGFLHNDIKPENILFTQAGLDPILIDMETMTEVNTELPRILGTRGYYPSNWVPHTSRLRSRMRGRYIQTSKNILDPIYTKETDMFALSIVFQELLRATDWTDHILEKNTLKETIQRLRYPAVAQLVVQKASKRSRRTRRTRK